MDEWRKYIIKRREEDLKNIITEEKLKPDKTYKFFKNAFRDGEIKTSGTNIDEIMPPISHFDGGNRAKKKLSIIKKVKEFFNKYFGICSW